MDKRQVQLLRDLLASSGWVERTRDFAGSLRRSTTRPGGLLLVGTPKEEPWHLAAHLDDEARFSGRPELTPTLVRYAPPPGAPPHLAQVAAAQKRLTLDLHAVELQIKLHPAIAESFAELLRKRARLVPALQALRTRGVVDVAHGALPGAVGE